MKEKGNVEMNDIEKKLEALKSEFLGKLEELRKEAEAQKEQEELNPWKPEVEEGYFYIGNTLGIGEYFNGGDYIDDKLITAGNCFRTKERAEQLHDILCPDDEPDWGSGEATYCLYYDHSSSRWAVDGWYDCNCRVNGAYFDTLENAEKVAEILNKELEKSK